jgi:hypothetical protein
MVMSSHNGAVTKTNQLIFICIWNTVARNNIAGVNRKGIKTNRSGGGPVKICHVI